MLLAGGAAARLCCSGAAGGGAGAGAAAAAAAAGAAGGDAVMTAAGDDDGGSYRRVHITEETYAHLDGKYQVEEGNGESRDSTLKGRRTYLVINPNTENYDTTPQVVSNHHYYDLLYRSASCYRNL